MINTFFQSGLKKEEEEEEGEEEEKQKKEKNKNKQQQRVFTVNAKQRVFWVNAKRGARADANWPYKEGTKHTSVSTHTI